MTHARKARVDKGETIAPYKVGKGKPPKHTRWIKGCASPNPKGRPQKPKPGSRKFDYYLDQKIEVPGPDGKIEVMTKRELVYAQIANMAAKGNLAAVRIVLAHDAGKEGVGDDPLLFDPELTTRLLAGAVDAFEEKPRRKTQQPKGKAARRARRGA